MSALDEYLRVKAGQPRRRKEKHVKEAKKCWWVVTLYQNGKVKETRKQYAATRRLAKEMAAQHWNVGALSMMTAVKDKR